MVTSRCEESQLGVNEKLIYIVYLDPRSEITIEIIFKQDDNDNDDDKKIRVSSNWEMTFNRSLSFVSHWPWTPIQVRDKTYVHDIYYK